MCRLWPFEYNYFTIADVADTSCIGASFFCGVSKCLRKFSQYPIQNNSFIIEPWCCGVTVPEGAAVSPTVR